MMKLSLFRTTAIFITIFLAWAAWGIFASHIVNPIIVFAEYSTGINADVGKAGTWGDSFGVFNSLFSALGFGAILMTLWSQANALKAQQIAFKTQQDDQHRQRFDTSFFELISLMRELRREIKFSHTLDFIERAKKTKSEIKYDTTIKIGTEAIRSACMEILLECHSSTNNFQTKNSSEDMVEIYQNNVVMRFGSTLGPYFRIIYTILYRIKKIPC